MATLKDKMLTGVIVTLLAVTSGQVIVTNWENTYYCEPENNVKECLSLSATNITCNTITGGDRCVGGTWRPISEYLKQPEQLSQFKVNANNKEWICQIKEDRVTSYTRCFSDKYEGYLGELI